MHLVRPERVGLPLWLVRGLGLVGQSHGLTNHVVKSGGKCQSMIPPVRIGDLELVGRVWIRLSRWKTIQTRRATMGM